MSDTVEGYCEQLSSYMLKGLSFQRKSYVPFPCLCSGPYCVQVNLSSVHSRLSQPGRREDRGRNWWLPPPGGYLFALNFLVGSRNRVLKAGNFTFCVLSLQLCKFLRVIYLCIQYLLGVYSPLKFLCKPLLYEEDFTNHARSQRSFPPHNCPSLYFLYYLFGT